MRCFLRSDHSDEELTPKANDRFVPKPIGLDEFAIRKAKNRLLLGQRAIVNTGKGKMNNDLKKSRWVWRPKGNHMDHKSKEKGSFIHKKFEYVDLKGISKSVVTVHSVKDKEPTQEYVLLLLHPHRPRIPVEDVIQDAQEKSSENAPNDKGELDLEDIAAEQTLKDDLERMVAQEMAVQSVDSYKASFEEEKRISHLQRAAFRLPYDKLNNWLFLAIASYMGCHCLPNGMLKGRISPMALLEGRYECDTRWLYIASVTQSSSLVRAQCDNLVATLRIIVERWAETVPLDDGEKCWHTRIGHILQRWLCVERCDQQVIKGVSQSDLCRFITVDLLSMCDDCMSSTFFDTHDSGETDRLAVEDDTHRDTYQMSEQTLSEYGRHD
ncbi:hypothetical protein Tco_0620861 [Tanacetum coccineum]